MEELKQQLQERLNKEWLSYRSHLLFESSGQVLINKTYETFCMKELAESYVEYTELSESVIQKLLQFDGNLLNHLYEEYMRASYNSVTSALCSDVDATMNKLLEMKLF